MDATPVATRLRRSIPEHDAYTIRVANRRVAALATAHPADARRWICKTRWLHQALLRSGRLVVGLGVQWTPVRGRGEGQWTPPPATLQLCAGHRCLIFHLAQLDADSLPTALYRFLADPQVVFVGYGSSYDRRMLREHYGLHVASGRDLRALAGMENASVELMAQRFLGYPGISKPWNVAMSAWHAPRLSVEQVEYACVDAYLAFRLGVLLCPGGHQPVQRALVPPRAPPPAPRALAIVQAHPRAPALQLHRAPGPALVLPRDPPPAPRAPAIVHAPPRAPVLQLHRAPGPALVLPRDPPPAPRALVLPRAPPLAPHAPVRPCPLPPATRAPVRPCPPPPSPRALVLPPVPPPTSRAPESHPAVAPTDVTVDAAKSSSKIAENRPGFTGSDTETERSGLTLLRLNYASDDDDDLSSDEFEFLGRGAVTDDDEEEEDVNDYLAKAGLLSDGDYVVGPGDHSDGDEEELGYAYKEYAGIGILTVDDHIEEGYKEYTGILTVNNEAEACDSEVFVSNGPVTAAFEEEVGLQLDGYHAPPEHFGEAEGYGDSTEAFQGGEDGYGQDDGGDWYDQGDDGYVQDDDSYDAFY